jgi:hypothetical protein
MDFTRAFGALTPELIRDIDAAFEYQPWNEEQIAAGKEVREALAAAAKVAMLATECVAGVRIALRPEQNQARGMITIVRRDKAADLCEAPGAAAGLAQRLAGAVELGVEGLDGSDEGAPQVVGGLLGGARNEERRGHRSLESYIRYHETTRCSA